MSGRHGGRGAGAPSQRARRMGEVVRHALAQLLTRGDFRDPDLQGLHITVTEVRPSPDLRSATVFVTPLGGGDATQMVKALKRAKGYLRNDLGKMLESKFTPELRFVADETFDRGERLEQAIKSASAQDVDRDVGHVGGDQNGA